MAATTGTGWTLFQEQRTESLVKAAPAILDALKSMVAIYDGLRDSLSSPIIIAKLKAADEAIARAEGRA